MQFELVLTEPAASDDVAFIRESLAAANLKRMGTGRVYKHFAIVARSKSGTRVGGAVAYLHWDWLFVDYLWVDESHRGTGLGKALLARAEKEAISEGVTRAHLATAAFQARPFYEKQGYEVFATLEDNPIGHRMFFMKKDNLVAD